MDPKALVAKLDEVLALPDEHECVEFKEAKSSYDFEKLGQYFSALSNEANLHGQEHSWFVMGVDKHHNVKGTIYKPHHASLQKLKHDIADHTALRFTFSNIYTVRYGAKGLRVLMFQIPAAPVGVPMSWRGHYYGRDHESTGALNKNEYDIIRAQAVPDWPATIRNEATIKELDPRAIQKARDGFKQKHSDLAAECDTWSDAVFLDKAKITRGGKVTNAALLLVGKPESAHLLSPANPAIFWVRKRADGSNADYVIALDKIQKGVRLDAATFNRLRAKRLVEGTRTTARIAPHIPGSALGLDQIEDAIVAVIRSGTVRSAEIAAAIMPRLPASLGEVQKTNKVRNALQRLARKEVIQNVGNPGRGARWKLLR